MSAATPSKPVGALGRLRGLARARRVRWPRHRADRLPVLRGVRLVHRDASSRCSPSRRWSAGSRRTWRCGWGPFRCSRSFRRRTRCCAELAATARRAGGCARRARVLDVVRTRVPRRCVGRARRRRLVLVLAYDLALFGASDARAAVRGRQRRRRPGTADRYVRGSPQRGPSIPADGCHHGRVKAIARRPHMALSWLLLVGLGMAATALPLDRLGAGPVPSRTAGRRHPYLQRRDAAAAERRDETDSVTEAAIILQPIDLAALVGESEDDDAAPVTSRARVGAFELRWADDAPRSLVVTSSTHAAGRGSDSSRCSRRPSSAPAPARRTGGRRSASGCACRARSVIAEADAARAVIVQTDARQRARGAHRPSRPHEEPRRLRIESEIRNAGREPVVLDRDLVGDDRVRRDRASDLGRMGGARRRASGSPRTDGARSRADAAARHLARLPCAGRARSRRTHEPRRMVERRARARAATSSRADGETLAWQIETSAGWHADLARPATAVCCRCSARPTWSTSSPTNCCPGRRFTAVPVGGGDAASDSRPARRRSPS